MSNINNPLYFKALHQAAHVVVALHFGWWISVEGISLEENQDIENRNSNSSHYGIFSKNQQTLKARSSILLAGELIRYNLEQPAELRRLLEEQIDAYHQAKGDSDLYSALSIVWQEFSDFQRAKEYILDSALATQQILHKHQNAVTEFADFLYTRKHVDYTDFVEFTFSAHHFKSLLDK